MPDNDILITALSKNGKINAYFAITTNTGKFAQKSHNMNIISSAIFCRALTAAALLSGNLKNDNDILSIKWNCDGPVKSIYVESTGDSKMRGYIGKNNLNLIEGSLKDNQIKAEPYIGFGDITISRIARDGKNPYNSVNVIETGEIAEDLSIYLKQSLQIESAVNIGLSINNNNEIEISGGIILMAMPEATDDDIKKINSTFSSISSFTDILKKYIKNTDIIKNVFDQLDMEIISTKNIEFKCYCNENKILNILKSLSKEEFMEYITDEGKIDAQCQYCGKKYSFLPSILEKYN